MEKFAVDLDKVLDEFEFNEDRAEQLANVLPKRRPPPSNNPRHQNAPPPYRRTPFEPITLADADYAAATPRPDVPQTWNVKNTLRHPEDVPNNHYDNNSFKDDEFMEHKPIYATNPEQIIETKWLQKSLMVVQDNKKASANRVNVSGVFSSLNEYVNAGAGSRVNVKDVKTVSNDLGVNKIKNLDKNAVEGEARNLPDVASTSNRPVLQNANFDLPNGTFDLVTNLTSELEATEEKRPSEDEVDSLENAVETLEIRNVEEVVDNVAPPLETPAPKPVSFAEEENVDDATLLTYLQDIENELEGTSAPDHPPPSPARPSDDRDLTRNLDLFCDGLRSQTAATVVDRESSVQNPTLNLDPKDPKSDIPDSIAVDGDYKEDLVVEKHGGEFVSSTYTKDLTLREKSDIPPGQLTLDALDATLYSLAIDNEPSVVEKHGGEFVSSTYTKDSTLREKSDIPPGQLTLDAILDSLAIKESSSEFSPVTVESVPVEDSSPDDDSFDRPSHEIDSDATSGDEGGVSAETAATLEMQADSKRQGAAILEVRSPMVQSPRDGSAIHVLGEEERPTRPKYLFLPSKITMGGNGTAEGEASSEDETPPSSQVGPAGATPHAYPSNPSLLEPTDNQTTLEENQNLINANDTSYDEGTTTGDDNRPTTEQLDNRANSELVGGTDANLSSPDYSESSVETMSPPPIVLAADPASLSALTNEDRTLGFVSPFWIPDNEASGCMLCDARFTVLRRRHHCRACGKVLCSKCCGLKARLEYMDNAEGRVCQPCHDILLRVLLEEHGEIAGSPTHHATQGRQPHPNNPMDYCSTIPPLQQVAGALHNPTPSVLVPVGVLKRQGSTRPKSEVAKQVMFSDGIRPGGDLTELDGSGEPRVPFRRPGRVAKRVATPPGPQTGASPRSPLPPLDPKTLSYIPSERGLPPVATLIKGELKLDDDMDSDILLTALRDEEEPPVMFAINRNFYVNVKILNLSCCVNRLCWCFSTMGLRCVSQDEILLVLETLPNETTPPRDVFCYFNTLYQDAVKGSTVSDLGCTLLTGPFLGSSDHGAFVYIRPSFQCLRKFTLPTAPYLVAILVHRSETPWARVFPIRLVLRLGAEFRYYPCSLVSVRNRKSVYLEIGHTIMNLLADFRNLSYTLPSVRGLVIHMEDRQTTILLPKNRYDQVTRALNNSNEHVLALAANLSLTADSHLVCVQSEGDLSYHTQAINIHSKPRRVTGASYVVFNGALKTSSNLTAKSSIVEDGLMVQITSDTMLALRNALRNMKDWSVGCGPTGAESPDETVSVQWVDDDRNFNVGVCSVIDGRSLDGIPSIRVHNGTDYLGRSRLVRWTEVFILKSDEGGRTGDPLDVGRLSESIARAVCHGLVKLLDLLAQADYNKFAIRASIQPDSVCYEGGSRGEVLPPIYMNSLDNELVPVLHTAATANENTCTMLELVFHVLLQ